MVGRVAWVTVLVLSMGLAGCLASEPVQETGSEVGASPVEGAEPVDVATVEPTEQVFAWDGQVGTTATVCAVVTCIGASPPSTWDQAYDVRHWHSAELTMTWDNPATSMGFGLADDGCEGSCDFETFVIGTSPLSLSVDGLDADKRYILVAWHAYQGVGPAGGQVGVETPFHIEGTILTD